MMSGGCVRFLEDEDEICIGERLEKIQSDLFNDFFLRTFIFTRWFKNTTNGLK